MRCGAAGPRVIERALPPRGSAATMHSVWWCNWLSWWRRVWRARGRVAWPLVGLSCVIALAAAPHALAQQMRGVSLTEDRVALVIGNAAYSKLEALDNPVNDARLIGRTLEKAGFKVTLRENLDRGAMFAALKEFGARLNENTVAVLYYAGHALQMRDQNFMIPVDAEIRSEDEIAIHGMDLTYILGQMSRAKSRVNVVILDACRDNPFAKRAPATSQGLAQMDAPIGTLLAYATAPGKQAPDGIGQRGNSVYTRAIGEAPVDARAAGRADVQAGARGGGARVTPAAGAVGAFVAARRIRVRAGPQCQQRGGRSRRQRRDRVVGQRSTSARGPTTFAPTCGSTRRAASPTSRSHASPSCRLRLRGERRHADPADAAGGRHLALPRDRTSSASATCSSPRASMPSATRASQRPGPPPPTPRCAPRWCR